MISRCVSTNYWEFYILISYLFVTILVPQRNRPTNVEVVPSLPWWDFQGGKVRRADAWCAVGFTFLAPLAFGRYNLLFVDSGGHCIQHASGDLNCFLENLGKIRFMELRRIRTCSRCWGLLFKVVWSLRRPGRLKIKVWSLVSRLQRLGVKLPTLSPFTQRPSIMAKDRKPPLSRQPELQVPLRSPLSDGFFGELTHVQHTNLEEAIIFLQTGGRDTKQSSGGWVKSGWARSDFETGHISLEDGIEETEGRLRHLTALFESSMARFVCSWPEERE